MSHGHDNLGEIPPDEPGTPPTNPGLTPPDRLRGTKPFTGGYYWFPTPSQDGVTWSIVTCRDLGCYSDAGHDADLWPRLMVPLAKAWGKEAEVLKRRLALSYTGLPRGRVTRPEKVFLILHGNDSPAARFEEMVIESFRLSGRTVRFLFDAHETQLPGQPEKFITIFGPLS